MANLGNLWFTIGLKDQTDADWEKIVKRVEQRGAKLGLTVDAQKLQQEISAAIANKKYTIDLSVAVKDNQVEAAIRNAYNRMNGANATAADVRQSRIDSNYMRADAYSKAQAQLERSRKALAELREARLRDAEATRQQRLANDELSRTMVKTNSITSQLRNEILNVYSIYTVQSFLRSVVEIGGEFEKQRLALGSILQDAGHATELFNQIKSLAVVSPFGIRELTSYTKQLAAYNIPYNELYETTKRLADISAGVGVDMSRIILAYGQVRSAEFLKGTELRQFTEAGIPLVQALADRFTELEGAVVSVGDVFDKIFKRQVSFEDVQAVLWEMTNEGGMFNNMQEVLSESLAGKWSNLKDAYDIMLADIAESNNKFAKWTIESMTALMNNWEAVVPVIFSAIGALGIYKAAMAANNTLHGEENLALTRNALLLKQKQADVLRVAMSYRTLTAAEQGIIASSNSLSTAQYKQLAVSGQLTKEYALRLMALGKLKSGQAGHIAQVLQISRAEMSAALNASRWRVAMASLSVSVRNLGVALKSMLFNPYTLIFAGLTAVMEMYGSWKQKNEEMEQNIRDLSQKATEGYKRIHEQLQQFEGMDLGKVRGDSLIASIEQVEETLENYSPEYGDIQKQADGISDLGERYGFLVEKLRETEGAYKELDNIKAIAENANETTDGWFDESLKENIEDYSDALQKSRKYLSDLAQYREIIERVLREIAAGDPEFAQAIAGKTFNEQIEAATSSYERYLAVFMRLRNTAGHDPFGLYYNSLDEIGRVLRNEVMPDLESFTTYLRNALTAEGYDFSNLSDEQRNAIRMLVNNFAEGFDNVTQDVRDWFANEVLTVKLGFELVDEDYVAAPKLTTYGQFIKDISPEGLFSDKELSSINDAGKAYDFVKKKVDEYAKAVEELERVNTASMSEEQLEAHKAALALNKTLLDDYKSVLDRGFKGLDEAANAGKGKGKDPVAEMWKERIDLMKEAESEYRKWSELAGKDQAETKLRESGLFGSLGEGFDFANIRGEMEKFLQEIQKAASTDKQREVVRGLMKQLFDFGGEDARNELDKSLKELEKYVQGVTERWNLFKKAQDATGDRSFAMNLAFGGTVDFGSQLEQLGAEIEKRLKDSGFSLSDVLSMDEDELAQNGLASLEPLVKAYREANDQMQSDTAETLIDLVGKYRDYAQKIADIERKLQEDIEKIESQRGKLGDEQADRLIRQRKKSAEEEKGSVLWEQFKDENDWAQVFDDLDRIGTSTLNNLMNGLEQFARTTDLSVEDTKELMQALRKLREETLERNPLQGFIDALNDAKKWRNILGRMGKGKDATYTLTENVGIHKAGETVTRAQAESGLNAAYEDETKSIDEVCKKLDALANGIDVVSGLFEALGNETLSDIGGILSGTAGGASSMASMATTLFGSAAGPWGAAAGAAIGLLTSVFQLHDKKLQRQIEESERTVRELQNVYDGVERALERYLGDGHAIKLLDAENDRKELKRIQSEMANIRSKGYLGAFDIVQLRAYGEEVEKLQKRMEAYDTGGAYGYNRQLLEEQYAELEKQRQAELDKKDTDESKILDYDSQLAELRDQITYFAQDLANELYGIDLKGWASELGDALYEAWMAGEDGAEAFRQKAGEIIGDVMNEILKMQILEPAMQQISDYLFGTDEERAANGGKGGVFGTDLELDEKEMAGLADRLLGMSEVSEEYYDLMDQLNEYLKKVGYDLKDLDGGDGLTGDIKGITEDTAGILASYLNAIRQDVSVKRSLFERFIGEDFPGLSALVQAQLAQLEMIARNTGANAESAAAILTLLQRNVNGGNKFHFS